MLFLGATTPLTAENQSAADAIPLINYALYPDGWKTRSGDESPTAFYEVVREDGKEFLRTVDRPEMTRIFRKLSWNSKRYPIIEWTWRVKEWPQSEEPQLLLYVSLDKDIFGIPTIIKYVWSRNLPEGSVKGGGFFRPIEVVQRSGEDMTGEWITERVDVYADFVRLIGREPRGDAYGIGLLVEPGVKANIGSIVATER